MSFAQEMKDMLGGFEAVSNVGMKFKAMKNQQAYRDATLNFNQDKLNRTLADHAANRASAELRTRIGANTRMAGISAANRRADMRDKTAKRGLDLREEDLNFRKGQAGIKADDAALGAVTGKPGKGDNSNTPYDTGGSDAAIDVPDDVPDMSADDGSTDDTTDDGGAYADGGLVRKIHAAGGGAIPDTAQGNPAPAPAARPAPAAQPAPAAPDDSDPDGDGAPDDGGTFDDEAIKATARQAAKVGMKALTDDSKKLAGGTASAPAAQKKSALPTDDTAKPGKSSGTPVDIMSTDGAPTKKEIDTLDKQIDPDNQLQPYMKGAARLAHLYQYALDQGNPDAAKQMAKRILQYNMLAARTQGSLAMQALQNGDTKNAAQLLSDAYDNVPDGRHLQTQLGPDGNVSYAVMDGDKVIQKGVANTAQLWGMAKNVASGQEFIKQVAQLAASDDTGESSGTGRKMTYSQAIDAYGSASKSYNDLLAKYNDPGTDDAAKRQMYDKLKQAQAAAAKARNVAAYVAQKAGIKTKDLMSDLGRSRKSQDSALPDEPPEEKPGMLSRAASAVGSVFSGSGKAPPPKQGNAPAAPTNAPGAQPAPPPASQPAAPTAGAPQGGKLAAMPPALRIEAVKALKAGKSSAAVAARIKQMGYDPSELVGGADPTMSDPNQLGGP